MNKTIFQIGLLAFCVSAVVFGTKNYALLDIVTRAFIVFVAVVIGIAIVLAVSAMFLDKRKATPNDQKDMTGKAAPSPVSTGKS